MSLETGSAMKRDVSQTLGETIKQQQRLQAAAPVREQRENPEARLLAAELKQMAIWTQSVASFHSLQRIDLPYW